MYSLNQIPSDAQIVKHLRRMLFGKNVWCPVCRARTVLQYGMRYRCRRCRVKFSLLSHTWLANMKLSLQTWWLLLWAWTQKVSVQQAMALAHMSEKGVRHWYDQFRAHLPATPVILSTIVQMDEAYFKKWSLVMGKEQGTRKVAYHMLQGPVERHHAWLFLRDYVRPRTRLRTDGAMIYRTIDQWWPVTHEYDLHKKFEFGKTSEIEGMFGTLRTFIRRMYHHSTPDKLPDYVREFCCRFSSPEIFQNPLFYLQKTLTLCTNRV